jgi:hypothetical protein
MAQKPAKPKWYQRLFANFGWLLFSGGGVLAIAGWIFVPSIYAPYVRVPSARLEFALNCVPEAVEIEVLSPYARARQAQISVLPTAVAPASQTVAFEVVKENRQSGTVYVQLQLSTQQLQSLAAHIATLPGQPQLVYSVLFDRIPNIDVQRINVTALQTTNHKCATPQYHGYDLMAVIRHQPQLMHYKIVQEKLSDIVLAFNDTIANFLLAAMVVAFLWFAFLLVYGIKELRFTSDSALVSRLQKRYDKATPELQEVGKQAVVQAEHNLIYRRLAFAKGVGPAFGFLLTVSSLSAALHPSVQATQDTFRFVSGIQIAVIATFVGLAIRIVAHFGQRTYRDLGERLLRLVARAA